MNFKRIFSVILALIVIASAVETISVSAEGKIHRKNGYLYAYEEGTAKNPPPRTNTQRSEDSGL